MSENDEAIDQVIVSATYFPRADSETTISTDLARPGIPLGALISFSESDAELRQSKFEDALNELHARFQKLLLGSVNDYEKPHEVDVSISLVPLSGQAGVVVTREMTENWEGCAVALYIDAIG